MDGQNFENNLNNEPNADTTSVVEPVVETVAEVVVEPVVENVAEVVAEPIVEAMAEPVVESVNVNTGSYSSYQDNYQDNTASAANTDYQYTTLNSGSYNYQDNATQYSAPVYGGGTGAEESGSTPGLAIGALAMGIASIVLSCCCGIGVIFGIAGLIMAIISNKKQKCGVGTAGLICSIVGLVFGGFYLVYYFVSIVFSAM